jgi:hypothetical protein
MEMQLIEQPAEMEPMAPARWIHDLDPRTMTAPEYNEMGEIVGTPHHGNSRQELCWRQKEMIGWKHDLFCLQSELLGKIFQGIDRGSIDISMASLSQSAETGGNAKSFQKALEHGRATIHGRSLDDFRR